MQTTEAVLPDRKCDPCTFICGSSISASGLTKMALLFPHNNHVEALTGTRSSSRAGGSPQGADGAAGIVDTSSIVWT